MTWVFSSHGSDFVALGFSCMVPPSQENGPTQQALQTPQPLHLEEVLDEPASQTTISGGWFYIEFTFWIPLVFKRGCLGNAL